jgi:hypothetical protein
LGNSEDLDVKPIAEHLITNAGADIITPAQEWTLAAWAYKMALLLEIAVPEKERRLTFTPAERHQFRETKMANEHIRIFLAKYKYGQHPAHAHQKLHTLTRRDDQVSFDLKVATITAGWLAMQVIAVRYVDTAQLAYAVSELEIELLGKTKTTLAPTGPRGFDRDVGKGPGPKSEVGQKKLRNF